MADIVSTMDNPSMVNADKSYNLVAIYTEHSAGKQIRDSNYVDHVAEPLLPEPSPRPSPADTGDGAGTDVAEGAGGILSSACARSDAAIGHADTGRSITPESTSNWTSCRTCILPGAIQGSPADASDPEARKARKARKVRSVRDGFKRIRPC